MIYRLHPFAAAAAAALLAAAVPAESQAPSAPGPTYADLADLAVGGTAAAPIAAHVRVAKAAVLKGAQAGSVRPGWARLLVQAQIVSLIRAAEGLPARLSYIVDLPRAANGDAPKLRKGSEWLLFAAPVAGRPGEIRLVAPDAQIAYSPQAADQLRAILREAGGREAAPRIVGIGRAFHVPGAIPGESETQIFLQTADRRPVSLNVLRRPGETPAWAVALSEIVDDSAGPPRPGTLLWYRLACTLPRALPAQSTAEADGQAAAAIRADYGFILAQLGPCARGRPRT